MRHPTIGSAMSDCPVVVEDDTPLDQARSLMYRLRIRHLPVVAGRRLVGILSERDVNLAAYLSNDLLDEASLSAGDACTQEPYTAEVNESLAAVSRTLAAKHIGSALVVEEGRLVGIFTAHDAFRYLSQMLDDAARPPRLSETVTNLAEVWSEALDAN